MWTYNYNYNNELYHHGIKGMKWGVRRYQNPDGSLTAAGKKRYGDKSPYEVKTADGDTFRVSRGSKRNYNTKQSKVTKTWGEHYKEIDDNKIAAKKAKNQLTTEEKKARTKKAFKVGAVVASTALAAYGAYKVSEAVKSKAFNKALEIGSKASSDYMKKYNRWNIDDLKTMEGLNRSNSLSDKLTKSDLRYAKESSKNLLTAIKTLQDKNPKLSDAQLLNMGIDLADYPEARNMYRAKNVRELAKKLKK